MAIKKVKLKAWEKEGIELFGKERKDWKFICSGCGMVQSVNQAKKVESLEEFEGYLFATIFIRCIGGKIYPKIKRDENGEVVRNKKGEPVYEKTIGCHTSLDEGVGSPGIILVIDDKEGHREVPIFDFARPEKIN